MLLTLRQGGCGRGTTAYKNAKQVRMNKPGLPPNTLIAFRSCSGIGSSCCFRQQTIQYVFCSFAMPMLGPLRFSQQVHLFT